MRNDVLGAASAGAAPIRRAIATAAASRREIKRMAIGSLDLDAIAGC
jgi:hypothetical protein